VGIAVVAGVVAILYEFVFKGAVVAHVTPAAAKSAALEHRLFSKIKL
jgi:hypothetical protein